MSLPVVNLDDRQFADLAAESRERLRQALPELAGLSPGDPLYFLVDCFAHLTAELIHRANLLPERQRRVFLNLMAVPQRPAQPARTLVSLDLDGKAAVVPKLVPKILPKLDPKLIPKVLPKLDPKLIPKLGPKVLPKIGPDPGPITPIGG